MVCVGMFATGWAQSSPRAGESPSVDAVAARVWGVTIDDVTRLDAIVESLRGLPAPMTARVVFDEGQGPEDYREAVTRIHGVARVMGELLDSSSFRQYDARGYRARVARYVAGLGNAVDVWEVANEINGEWLGARADVVAKMTAAYDEVVARGGRTALTLHYNEGCAPDAEHAMFPWVETNVPQRMRDGVDYVWLSFYEDDCPGARPDWPQVFRRLGRIFPRARLGFGEVGTKIAARKAALVMSYYAMSIDHPRYVGGYFWWYFVQDMVPRGTPLWKTLAETLPAEARGN